MRFVFLAFFEWRKDLTKNHENSLKGTLKVRSD